VGGPPGSHGLYGLFKTAGPLGRSALPPPTSGSSIGFTGAFAWFSPTPAIKRVIFCQWTFEGTGRPGTLSCVARNEVLMVDSQALSADDLTYVPRRLLPVTGPTNRGHPIAIIGLRA
jgi:hypothetical protein